MTNSGDVGATPASKPGPYLDVLAGLFLLSPLWGVLIWQARRFEAEDALIYLRYVRNLHEHGELVYNLGERFNGITSPLFMLVSIGVTSLSTDMVAAVNLTCGLWLVAAAAVMHLTVASEAGRLAGAIAAVLVLVSPFFYYCFGMETTLFLLLTAVSLRLYLREQWGWLALSLGLLLITRSEGVFLLFAIAVDMYRRWGASGWLTHRRALVPLILPSVLVSLANLLYYGQVSPHTALAKFGQGLSGYWGRWPLAFLNALYHFGAFWGRHWWLCLVAAVLLALGVWRQRGSRLNRVVLPFLAAYGGTFVLLNVPHYHWYYAVFYFFGLGYAAIGLASVVNDAAALRPAAVRGLAVAALTLLGLGTAATLAQLSWRSTADMGPPSAGDAAQRSPSTSMKMWPALARIDSYRVAGLWIASHTRPADTVAGVEIGTLGWYSDRPIIDIMGLVTRANARAIASRDVTSWLTRYAPAYVLIHERPWVYERVAAEAEKRGLYESVPEFDVPSLRLLRRRPSADLQ